MSFHQIKEKRSNLGNFQGFSGHCGFDPVCIAGEALDAGGEILEEVLDTGGDIVDNVTGGAWTSTREAREEAADLIVQTANATGQTIGKATQDLLTATEEAVGAAATFLPRPMTAKEQAEFNRNPALFVVNVVTAPFAGWIVELMQRMVERTGKKSVPMTLSAGSMRGQTITLDLEPKPSDSMIQTAIKLVGWVWCCTFGLNTEIARKLFGMNVGTRGFLGTYQLKVPGQSLVHLPVSSAGGGGGASFGGSEFWTEGMGPTGVEETGAAAGTVGMAEASIFASATAIVGILFDLLKCVFQPGHPDCSSGKMDPSMSDLMANIPDSDYAEGSGDKSRSSFFSGSSFPFVLGGAVGVGLLFLYLINRKK